MKAYFNKLKELIDPIAEKIAKGLYKLIYRKEI